MTRESYEKCMRLFETHHGLRRALILTDRLLTAAVFLAYPALLAALFFTRDTRFLRCLLVPAVTFLAVSALRKWINAERPYEKWGFQPILHKEKHGESFPSRHVFSVFVIALAFYRVWTPAGILLTAVGVLLGTVRVVGGVHFPRDVLVGAAIGVAAGAVGFFLF